MAQMTEKLLGGPTYKEVWARHCHILTVFHISDCLYVPEMLIIESVEERNYG